MPYVPKMLPDNALFLIFFFKSTLSTCGLYLICCRSFGISVRFVKEIENILSALVRLLFLLCAFRKNYCASISASKILIIGMTFGSCRYCADRAFFVLSNLSGYIISPVYYHSKWTTYLVGLLIEPSTVHFCYIITSYLSCTSKLKYSYVRMT